MSHREGKKAAKMQDKKRAKPEIISEDEIKKSVRKGVIKGTE